MVEGDDLLEYPSDITAPSHGAGGATMALVVWVKLGMEAARRPRSRPPSARSGLIEQLVPSLESLGIKRPEPAPPLVEPGDALWSELARYVALSRWIYAASREPGIPATYGTSTKLLDEPWLALAPEVFAFLNDMIYRHELLSSLVAREAASLWEGLAAGVETSEVGTYVDGLQAGPNIGPTNWGRT